MDEEDKHFLSASHQKCILLSGTECPIINYLLTKLVWAVPGIIGPWLFLCARSRPWANIPQYGPRARLVRSYYCLIIIIVVGFYWCFCSFSNIKQCQERFDNHYMNPSIFPSWQLKVQKFSEYKTSIIKCNDHRTIMVWCFVKLIPWFCIAQPFLRITWAPNCVSSQSPPRQFFILRVISESMTTFHGSLWGNKPGNPRFFFSGIC